MIKRGRSTQRSTSRTCSVCGRQIRDTWNGQDAHIKTKAHRDAVARTDDKGKAR